MRISDWSSDVCSSDLRIEETPGQRLAAAVVLDNPRFQIFDPDPFDPRRGAFQITRLFAVELDEGGAIIHRLLLGLDLAEQVRHADLDAAIAAEIGRAHV